MERRYCLVTGASSGIGAALAEEFARHGWDLCLTGRHEARLSAVAARLQDTYRNQVDVLLEDLADSLSVGRLVGRIERPVDGLVNCAGYAPDREMLSTPWGDHQSFLQTLLAAPTELALHYAAQMKEREFGKILNISSVLGFLPPSGRGSLYGPAKSYIIGLSESLHASVGHQGVQVTAVCPGFTKTPIFETAGIEQEVRSAVPKPFWQTPEAVAREAYRANEAGKVIAVTGRHNRFIVSLLGLLPRSVGRKLVGTADKGTA